ncbi:hypothetical protein GCM10023108_24120 [Saccharopolyspora hordei]
MNKTSSPVMVQAITGRNTGSCVAGADTVRSRSPAVMRTVPSSPMAGAALLPAGFGQLNETVTTRSKTPN